jgi:uncharacterized protein
MKAMPSTTTDIPGHTTGRSPFPIGVTAAALLLFGSIAATAAFLWNASREEDFGQPHVERLAQRRLPESGDPLWRTLQKTSIHEDDQSGVYTADFPSSVQSLAGRQLTVDGFMLPLDSKHFTQHFLLSRYTPVCPFCPPGRPNEVVEVFSSEPVPVTESEIAVSGRFGVHKDTGSGLFFRLDGADVD